MTTSVILLWTLLVIIGLLVLVFTIALIAMPFYIRGIHEDIAAIRDLLESRASVQPEGHTR